jgi:nucleoside 2-deoxyribosyltransferase
MQEEIKGKFEVHHKNGEPLDNRPENRIAVCRACHNLREGKKPSIKHIQNLRDGLADNSESKSGPNTISESQSVYLAGTMTYHGEDSYWSASIKDGNSTVATWREALGDFGPLRVNSPQDIHFDHGGDLVEGVAGSDIALLQESDAILAYFDKKEQVGTLTELMYAIMENKPALVLFKSGLIAPPAIDPFEDRNQTYQWLDHPIAMRFESPIYWFLVNFLLGDNGGWVSDSNWGGVDSDVKVGVVSGTAGVQKAYSEWVETDMQRYSGQKNERVCQND